MVLVRSLENLAHDQSMSRQICNMEGYVLRTNLSFEAMPPVHWTCQGVTCMVMHN